jgi:thioredoxin reductase (NADPH)
MSPTTPRDVIVVGGGVAGLAAATFTARHDLDTLVIDAGESILRRNAHLENFPGFPAGINPRLLLDCMTEQVRSAGAAIAEGRVTAVESQSGDASAVEPASTIDPPYRAPRFTVETADGDRHQTAAVVAATKNVVDYIESVDGVGIVDRGKTFVDCDDRGRTGVDGLYAAGRLAEKPHQAVVCAGHGAEVAVTLLDDLDRPFYHDWVAPEGYFTGRGRDVPPGCEEIDAEERAWREAESRRALRETVETDHPDPQETHPSLSDRAP